MSQRNPQSHERTPRESSTLSLGRESFACDDQMVRVRLSARCPLRRTEKRVYRIRSNRFPKTEICPRSVSRGLFATGAPSAAPRVPPHAKGGRKGSTEAIGSYLLQLALGRGKIAGGEAGDFPLHCTVRENQSAERCSVLGHAPRRSEMLARALRRVHPAASRWFPQGQGTGTCDAGFGSRLSVPGGQSRAWQRHPTRPGGEQKVQRMGGGGCEG